MRPVGGEEHPLGPALDELTRDRADVFVTRRAAFRAVIRRRQFDPAASRIEQAVHRAHAGRVAVNGCGEAADVIDHQIARKF
jgi:hypothetical protein